MSAATDRDLLFSPIRIGHREVQNRLVQASTSTGLGRDGVVTARNVAFVERRARGGVGTIISEALLVHPTSVNGYGTLGTWDDKFIPGLKQLSRAVTQRGVCSIGQLAHGGRQLDSSWSRLATWAPSAISAFPAKLEIAHEMEIEEIQEVVHAFAMGARRCREAGFDGVEIHGAHGLLIQQFLSPYSNHRTDEYGGPLQNRLRFLYEIISAVRSQVGADFIVGLKLSAAEFVPGGLTLEDTVGIVPLLEGIGKLDYFLVSVGGFGAIETIHPTTHFELSPFIECAAAVKKVTRLPVMAVGKIKQQASEVVREGKADLVAMARPLISDPDLPTKIREGREEEVRSCLSCNECHGRLWEGKMIGCTYNPEVGYETEGELLPATVPKRVVVIGGGPAGCEAARVAALRGHKVILLEKDPSLGGRVQLAAMQPGRQDYALVPFFYAMELGKLGVDIRLETCATPELVLSLEPDAVVVATGTVYVPPDIPGVDLPHVHWADRVILEEPELGGRVVVYDLQFHVASMATAEMIASWGKLVDLVTPVQVVGHEVEINTRTVCHRRLAVAGVGTITDTILKEIHPERVVLANRYSGRERVMEGVTAVVLSVPGAAADATYRALKGRVPELHLVGDAYSPRRIMAGVRDAYLVAGNI